MKHLLFTIVLLAGCAQEQLHQPVESGWNKNYEIWGIKRTLEGMTQSSVSYDYEGRFTIFLPLSKDAPSRSEIQGIVEKFRAESKTRLKYSYHVETVEEAIRFRQSCAEQFLNDIKFLKEHNRSGG